MPSESDHTDARGALGDRAALEAFRRGEAQVLEAVYKEHCAALEQVFRFGFSVRRGDGSRQRVRAWGDELEIEV